MPREELDRALALAYRYLSRRERTIAEMRAHLLGKSEDASAIDRAIELLVEEGYLDDARFVRLFAQDKRTLEQWGSGRIRLALRQRGLDPDLIDTELATGGEPGARGQEAAGSELDRAIALLQGRFALAPRDRRERDRAIGVLLRKGYDHEVALEALARYAREAA